MNITLKITGAVILLFIAIFFIMEYQSVGSYESDLTAYFVERAISETRSLEANINSMENFHDGEKLSSQIIKLMWLDSEIVGISYSMPAEGGMINFVSSDAGKINSTSDPENIESYENDVLITRIYQYGTSKNLRIVSPVHVSGYIPGTVQLDFTMETVYKKISSVALTLASWYILLMVTSIILLFLFLRIIIIKPIMSIRDGVESLSRNDFIYDVKIKSGDELGSLSDAFGKMSNDLKESRGKIEDYSKNLEKNVTERTKDLDTKISELTEMKTAILNMMDDTDVTNKELVKMQDELRKSLEELRKLDVKKDEFISIAAHELKTPLTSIHGFSQLLLGSDVSGDREKRDKYLKIIDSETKRVAKLVTDILDLSRLDLGTVRLNLEEVNIKDLVENVQKEMDIQITAKGLKSEYILKPNIPKISTDRERLTQILLNLINNAVKYTPKGKITVKIYKDGNDVHFIIKDTGIGIAKEYNDKLFHRFFQIDSSYTRQASGTGLGLALCKEFVTLMSGKIWFASEVGKGSEFHFTLPIKNVIQSKTAIEKMKAEDVLKKSQKVSRKFKAAKADG